jgi:polynucleotide 5'-hydroxyl-kinase GRC3/NOL9
MGGVGGHVGAPHLLDAVAGARVTVVIGDVNRGKTTLVARLASELFARGRAVGVLDADVGQSEIGPPTTVGLGRVTRPLARLGDAEPVALRFVGVTSVVREQAGTVAAIARLADRARELGLAHLLVDTSGLVRGDLGQRIKQAKIEALDPDLLVAVDDAGECEPVLAAYRKSGRPAVLSIPPVREVRTRSADERRQHRERALAAHFAGARRVTLDLGRVALRRPALFVGEPIDPADLADLSDGGAELLWGERRGGEVALVSRAPLSDAARRTIGRALGAAGLVDHALDDLVGMLAALEDASFDTRALGAVVGVDFERRAVTVDTGADPSDVHAIAIGRERARSY